VSAAQSNGAELPGVRTVHRPCTGDGSPSCGQIAESWRGPDGRRLPALRKALGLPEAGRIFLAGFSAGGHLIWRILQDPRDRDEVAGVYLADGTYTTEWKDERARVAAPMAPYVDFGRFVMGDPSRLFIATASAAPNKNHPTGAETLTAIADALSLPSAPLTSGLPPARRAWGAGANLRFFDYGNTFSHAQQVTALAQKVWPILVAPHFETVRA